MRARAAALAALIAAAGTLAAAAALWWLPPGAPVELAIPHGSSAAETAALLKGKGVVPSAWLLRAAMRASGAHRHLKPGLYRFGRHSGLGRVLRALKEGRTLGTRVVVPEGFSTWQIAERLEAAGVCRAAEFRRVASDQQLEGYLYPTTYFFEQRLPAEKVAAKMRAEFERTIGAEYAAARPQPKQNLHQLVTLASIVEREAVRPPERPMIAAVYLNRLRLRMRLEADPTVQYALGAWKKGLTSADVHTDSRYNTYVHFGLPPGPICSPGLESFRAALRPADTQAVYFVADNKGGHVFSSTHDEHLKAKQSFKRGLRELKARLRREQAQRRAGGAPPSPPAAVR